MTAALSGHLPSVATPDPIPAPTSRPSLQAVSVPVRAESERRESTFRAMYDAHVDFVWRNLRRLGVAEADAEDRTQEVFVVAHRRFAEFADRGHGPARLALPDRPSRCQRRAPPHIAATPRCPTGASRWIAPASSRTRRRPSRGARPCSRLDAALASIDLGRRAVLVLHEIEEMTAREIAQVLAIPLNTVYSRLRVGRIELEQALARHGGDR